MGSEAGTLTVVAVLLIAGLMIAQSLLLMLITSQLSRKLDSLNRRLSRLSDLAHRGLQIPHRILDVAEDIVQSLPRAEGLTDQAFIGLTDATERVDQAISRKIERLHTQAQETCEHLDKVLSRFSQETFKLHSIFLNPTMRLSALVQGGVVTLKRLLSRTDGQTGDPPDKQIFI